MQQQQRQAKEPIDALRMFACTYSMLYVAHFLVFEDREKSWREGRWAVHQRIGLDALTC